MLHNPTHVILNFCLRPRNGCHHVVPSLVSFKNNMHVQQFYSIKCSWISLVESLKLEEPYMIKEKLIWAFSPRKAPKTYWANMKVKIVVCGRHLDTSPIMEWRDYFKYWYQAGRQIFARGPTAASICQHLQIFRLSVNTQIQHIISMYMNIYCICM